jgi:hypothetical protein
LRVVDTPLYIKKKGEKSTVSVEVLTVLFSPLSRNKDRQQTEEVY